MMEPYYVVTRFEVDMGSDRQCRRLTSQVMGDGWMPAAAAGGGTNESTRGTDGRCCVGAWLVAVKLISRTKRAWALGDWDDGACHPRAV